MEGVDRLNYGIKRVEDAEPEVSLIIKQTVDQGINDNGVLSFRFPPDPVRFTDLNSALLKVQLRVERQKEPKDLTAEDKVFLDMGGIDSLFSSCDVRINGELVSSMTAYPYTSRLCRYLGTSNDTRTVWSALNGTWETTYSNSDLGTAIDEFVGGLFLAPINKIKGSKTITLFSRINSDFLSSCRQFLPPGSSLSIHLKRAPDDFSLCSYTEKGPYRIVIEKASVYLRRIRLNPELVKSVEQGIGETGANLTFNRLETRIMSIPKGNKVWRWLDCLNGEALPNRLYVGFVSQDALYGSLSRISTYFEHLNVSSVNVKLNGRDILVDPINVKFGEADDGQTESGLSDAKEGYVSLLSVMDQITNQSTAMRFSYYDYIGGMSVFAIELGKCGEKSGDTGLLDLELTFGDGGSSLDGCVMLFTEKTENARVYPRLTSTI